MDIIEKLKTAAPSEFLMLEAAIEIETLRKDIEEFEKTAEGGYAEAWEIITQQRGEIAKMKKDTEELQKEFECALLKGYDEAYRMIAKLRKQLDESVKSSPAP